MSKKKNKLFAEQLKEYGVNKKIQLPEHIDFEFINNAVKITLPAGAVGINMQTDDAAFEGWTIVVCNILQKSGCKGKFVLDIQPNNCNGISWEQIGEANSGHYNRFLYRLMKFNDSYAFVELTSELKKHLGEYYYKKDNAYYKFNDSQLFINKPMREASCNNKKETIIEKKFSDNQCGRPERLINKTQKVFNIEMQKSIFRQLPVGIFKDAVKKENAIFTGGASAIDLWGLSEDKKSMCVYELKIEENTKVGIISELFFYANLMYDVNCGNPHFKKPDVDKRSYRGYDSLKSLDSIETIYAVFLVERLHPLIDDNVMTLLTCNNIRYTIMKYKYTCNIEL